MPYHQTAGDLVRIPAGFGPLSGGTIDTSGGDWVNAIGRGLAKFGEAVVPPVVAAIGGVFGAGLAEKAVGMVSTIVPNEASGVVDSIQPYIGGLNFGSIMPGVITQASPQPGGPEWSGSTGFMNPPPGPGGYSTALHYGRRFRRRPRGRYRIMRGRRRRRY